MIDPAGYRYWWGVLRRAEAAEAPLPDDARAAFFPVAPLSNPRISR